MKKGIELSLNFLVTIIIALVIFGFGIKFIYNLAKEATGLETLTTEELDKQIEDLLCDSTDKVCIGTNKKVIEKGKFAVFGIKIINILDEQDFIVNIEKPDPSGYAKNNRPIDTNNIELKYRDTPFSIKKNEEKDIGIGVGVPKDAVSGTYILDVKIEPYYSEDETTIQKIYVEVP